MTTGEMLRVRAAMKPIATVPRALRTVDVATGEEAVAHHQRSDVCAVPAAGIVAEAMVALVLADAVLEKFGGDSVDRDPPQRRELPGHPEVSGDRPRVVLVGPMGAGKTTVAALLAERLGRWPSATPTPTSRPPRAARSPRSSSTTARRYFRDARGRGRRRGARRARRRAGPGRRSGARPRDPRARSPATASSSCASGSPRLSSGSGSAASRPLLLGNVRARSRRCSTSARPSTSRWPP